MADFKRNFKELMGSQMKKMSKETPMMSYMWYMELPILGEDTPQHQMDISSRISNITVPFLQYETDKQPEGNSFRYYAKSVDIGTISFEIIEMSDGGTRRYLERWQNLMLAQILLTGDDFDYERQKVTAFNPPKTYKKNINVFRLDNMKNSVYADEYSGYFISGIEEMTSDYESSEFVKYNVTLTGDGISHLTPEGEKDAIKKKTSRLEELANKVGNVKEFLGKVKNARTSVRSIADILS